MSKNNRTMSLLKLAVASTLGLGLTAGLVSMATAAPAASGVNPAVDQNLVKQAEQQIIGLNANFNQFSSNRDYENFIQSRSKLLKRNASDDLRDINVEAQPVTANSILIKKFKFFSEDNINFLIIHKLEREAAKFAGQKFTARKMAALKNNLNNILIRAGYVTSIIYIPAQDIAGNGNEVTFNIKWGRVNSVYVNKTLPDHDSFKNRAMLLTLPSFYKDVLKISTIDQIVEDATTPNKDVRLDVSAAPNLKGYSDIVLNPYRTLAPKFSATLNNANDKDQPQLSLNLSEGDIIGINDTWTLGYTKRLLKDMGNRHTDIISLGYDQPIGFFRLNINNQWVRFKNTNEGTGATYITRAPSFKTDWKLSYVAFRDKTRIVNVYAGLNVKFSTTDIRFEKSNANVLFEKKRNTEAKFGVNYLDNAFLNGRLYADLSYTQQLGLFDGGKSADPNDNSVYQAFAKTLNLYLNYNKNFILGKTIFNSSTTFQAQKSLSNYLGSGYRVSYGDAYSVRGLRQFYMTGDNGVNILTNFGPMYQLQQSYLTSVNPYLGLDFGATSTPEFGNNKSESYHAASVSLGVAVGGPHWRASVNVGTPFAYSLPNTDDNKKPGKVQIYGSLSVNY